MDVFITITDEQLDELATRIAARVGITQTTAVDDDLAGDDKPEEEKKVTLTDVQDAIRRAGVVNKDKTKAVLVKHVPKGKEPRGTNLDEAKWQVVIDELAKIK